MKTIKQLSFIMFIGILLMSSCRKKENTDTQDQNSSLTSDQSMIQNFFDTHRKKAQTFTIDATLGGTVYTDDGTAFRFLPNSFMDATGASIVGAVDLEIHEYNKPSEMLLANKPTTNTTGEILISAGEFFVTATSGGTPVLVRGQSATIGVPRDSSSQTVDDMRSWSGDTLTYVETNGWDYQNVPTVVTSIYNINPGILWTDIGPTASTPTTFEMALDSLGTWRNCDVLYQITGPKTTLLCYMSEFNDSSMYASKIQPSMVFIRPRSINSLIKLNTYILNPPAGYEGFLSYQNTMPIGEVCDMLAITAKGGKFYAELRTNEAIPSPSVGNNYSTISFNMQEVSESDLLSLILSLD